jgi:hypothetical protein
LTKRLAYIDVPLILFTKNFPRMNTNAIVEATLPSKTWVMTAQ